HFVTTAGGALRVGATLVRLVDDDEVPPLLPDALPHVLLLRVVEGGDHLCGALPRIDELLLVDCGEDDVEWLPEPTQELVLPLDRERGRAQNENPLDRLAELELLDQQAGHDRLAGSRIIRQKKA